MSAAQTRPPPANYICFRCGQKGHFISFCPTLGEKEFDRPKMKKTTGIPRAFLKKVENPQEGAPVMVTEEGNFVVATANEDAWNRLKTKAVQSNESLLNHQPEDDRLQCKLCKFLLKTPVRTPCCKNVFCLECITKQLLHPEEGPQFYCPKCGRSDIKLDKLRVDEDLKDEIIHYTKSILSGEPAENVNYNRENNNENRNRLRKRSISPRDRYPHRSNSRSNRRENSRSRRRSPRRERY